MNIQKKFNSLLKDIPAVFIALKKKETPVLAKILAALVICYALSPIDLIPDFIPVIGLLDDILILPLLIAAMLKLIPKDLFQECKKEAEDLWVDGKPKKWYYSLPIIFVWILLLIFIISLF